MDNDSVSDSAPSPQSEIAPAALIYCADLMFGVPLANMARKAGLRPVNIRAGDELPEAVVLVVDLSAKGDWEEIIRSAAARGVPVVAFGPHMDTASRKRARDAGASRVLANSNLYRDLPLILHSIAGAGRSPTSELPGQEPD